MVPDTSGPRRRIPKQARARERVERILDAARTELEGRPATDITIESIAERAGVAVGSVYSYFSSKTALLLAVAATVMDEADAETARQLAQCRNLPWREAVERTVEATLGSAERSRSAAQGALDDLVDSVDELRKGAEERLARSRRSMTEALEGRRPATSDDIKELRAELRAIGRRLDRIEERLPKRRSSGASSSKRTGGSSKRSSKA